MNGERSRPSWVPIALALGIGYVLVGIVFARPTTHAQAWRLAAWAVSGIGYAWHIWHENARLRHSPAVAAWHVAVAVALGACALAVGANIHAMSVDSPIRQRQLLLLAIVLWPLITALPAFLLALGIGAVVTRLRSTDRAAR